MKAIAKDTGFYNGRRVRPGQVFEVKAGAKGKWFDLLPEEAPAKPAAKAKGKADAPPDSDIV